MDNINVQTSSLRGINTQTTQLNEELSSIFGEIITKLEELCNNVKSQSLTNATSKINTSINAITAQNTVDINGINAFLLSQTVEYETHAEEASSSISNLNSIIESNLGSISAGVTNNMGPN